MKTTPSFGCCIALFIFLSACDSISPGVHKVAADFLSCTVWVKNACLNWEATGEFTVSLNPAANSCSLMYENFSDDTRKIIRGVSLAYVDSENWECKIESGPMNLQKVANLSNGTLSVASVDLDALVATEIYHLRRSDEFIGGAQHYVDWFKRYAERKRNKRNT